MTTKTVRMKASEITKDWRVVDAAGRPLGRVASEVAALLRGKHKPTFEPHLDGGDFVIVINASQVRLSGRKAEQMVYYRHSGYPGGLKSRGFAEQLERHPTRVIEQAVWGMLPDGPLGKKMLRHLKVYGGPKHPHEAQVTGSARASEARKAALAETLTRERKPRRLRPLPAPQLPTLLQEFPEAQAAIAAPPPKPRRPAVETTLPGDGSAAGADAALEPEPVLEAANDPVEPPVSAAPRRSRKKADPAAAGDESAATESVALAEAADMAEAGLSETTAPTPRPRRRATRTEE